MSERFGNTGRILIINASKKTWAIFEPDEETIRKFIGGRGIAGFLLRPFAGLPFDSPEMPLVFMTGPLTDTAAPSSGRFCVMSKSPLTETVFSSSAGGTFGAEMKKAGWDGIVLTGKSPESCGIVIFNNEVSFRECLFTDKMTVRQRSGQFKGGSFAVTGPAADNGVLFSSICFSGDPCAGRGGLGLVMASKNIKFIHVTGTGSTPVYDNNLLTKAREDILRLVSASPVLMGEHGITRYGNGSFYDLANARRIMPCMNFRGTFFRDAHSMNAYVLDRMYKPANDGCSGCTILCSRKLQNGSFLPGYDAMAHMSALIGNASAGILVRAAEVCAAAGMDPVSAASTIACYMEINGFEPDETDPVKLLENIVLSRNEGELLKNGSRRYASDMGRGELSMSVKGLELPAFDPRGAYGTALSYTTSTTGGCYKNANAISHEILRKPVATDRFSFKGKGRIIKLAEDMYAVADSLTVCSNVFYTASLEEYARVYHAVTGTDISGHELMSAGERIYYHEKIMNYICGFTSSDDDLPRRFFTEAGSSGDGIDIPPIDRENFLDERARYYRIRGLSPDGIPQKEKCEELGLEWAVLN